MIFELPASAPLLAAAFFLAAYVLRRGTVGSRACMFWALSYTALFLALSVKHLSSPGLEAVAVSAAVAFMWAGACMEAPLGMSRRRMRLIVMASTMVAFTVQQSWGQSPQLGAFASSLIVGFGAIASAALIWSNQVRARVIATTFVLQGLAILAAATGLREAPLLRYFLALASVALPVVLALAMLRHASAADAGDRRAGGAAGGSSSDALTGVQQRDAGIGQLRDMIEASKVSEQAPCAISVNIEGFRRINAAYGVEACDDLLRQIARILTHGSRGDDLIARMGPDEFLIVAMLPRTYEAVDRAQWMATRWCDALAVPYGAAGQSIVLRFRIGVDLVRTDLEPDVTAHQVIARLAIAAETVRMRAPTEPRWAFYEDGMQAVAKRSASIEGLLASALAANEFSLVYQPIVDYASGRVVKVEALLRWNSPQLGDVPPTEVIAAAERSGFVVELGAWVLEQACKQAALWARERDRDRPLVVGVNASARQMESPQFADSVFRCVLRHQLPPNLLDIELTESALVSNERLASANIERLREFGIGVSLDDFGTGFASLQYLMKFQTDTIKIDRSFVTGVTTDPVSRALATAICTIAKQMRMRIVAEGVETADQASMLAALGVIYMQGYLYGRPSANPPDRVAHKGALRAVATAPHAIEAVG